MRSSPVGLPQHISLPATFLFLALAALPIAGCSCSEGFPAPDADEGGIAEAGVDAADANDGGIATETCGNAVFDEFEACEKNADNTVSPALRCICDDGNPCTLDGCLEGTSADDCTCVCDPDPPTLYNVVGTGTCNDGNPCTNDIAHCTDPSDTTCAATCSIASCDHVTVASCIPGCGNGVADPGETCESGVASLPSCNCNDGNACTDDFETGGMAATCTLSCMNTPKVGYRYSTCDDGLACTNDSGLLGTRDDQCRLPCQHDPNPGWDAMACSASLPACCIPQVQSSDLATCSSVCTCMPDPSFVTNNCIDSLPCTLNGMGTFNPNDPASNVTCDLTCAFPPDPAWIAMNCVPAHACITASPSLNTSAAWCNLNCNFHDTRTDADAPDPAVPFADTNCDSLDGNVADMIFVDGVAGTPSGPGTRAQPYRTINQGIVAAQGSGKHGIAIAKATYDERVVVVAGISLYGGYLNNAGTWTRSAAAGDMATITNTAGPSGGALETIVVTGINAITVIDRLKVRTGNTAQAGASVYAIRVFNSSAITLRNLDVVAGNAGGGTSSPQPAQAAQGGNGGNNGREPGAAGTNASCSTNTAGGTGGWGGANSGGCHPTDAMDGKGGNAPGYISCSSGGTGSNSGDCGSYGGAGSGGNGGLCGPVSTNGSAGSGAVAHGTVNGSGLWVPSSGGTGMPGTAGVGGAGGGGGGGAVWDDGRCNMGTAGGGGGGGAGGCGGSGGPGGGSGAGSFALFASNSTVSFYGGSFTGGVAGNGVSGAAGGLGGDGGQGGPVQGGGSCSVWPVTYRSGAGGQGGSGRQGGQGGQGGGGAGGVSSGGTLCNTTQVVESSAPAPSFFGGTKGNPAGGGADGVAGGLTSVTGTCQF